MILVFNITQYFDITSLVKHNNLNLSAMPLLSFSDCKKSAVKTTQRSKKQTTTSTGAAKKGKGTLQQLEQTLGGNSSDSSTASKVTTRSSNQNIDQQEDNEEEDEPGRRSIYVATYRCKKCFTAMITLIFFGVTTLMYTKNRFLFVELIHVLDGLNLRRVCEVMLKIFTKKALTCEHCGLVNLTPVQLNAHLDTHVNANFTCNGCQKDFTRKDDSNRHWKYSCTKNPDRVTQCKHCIKVGIDPEVPGAEPGILNHLQTVHKQKGVYLCTFCHNLFKSNQQITAHSQRCTKTHPLLS